MMYPLVFITDRFIREQSAACARGPVVFIRPEYKDDAGIRAHEIMHVKQWFISLGLHSLLYLLVPEYRLGAEVAAYKVQAKHYDDDRLPMFAEYISKNYGIDITPEASLSLLKET